VGDEVRTGAYSREQRQLYREKVHLCLDVFERMLAQSTFDFDRPLTGMEIELNLVDGAYQPMMTNLAVLEKIADSSYQTELGAFNIEFNVPPRPLPGTAALELEDHLRASLNEAEAKASELGAHIVMTGILPTLMGQHLEGEWMTTSRRYAALNESIFTFRGEDMLIDIAAAGPDAERLTMFSPTIAPEAACTSLQLHLQVAPSEFAANWNAAQVLLGPQGALAANSPFFFGRRLWAETRIELFKQATDTRPEELRNQGVRPRVFFGERWITSIFDLFEENARYFPSLLPEVTDEDPLAVLEAGGAPQLQELRLHNGTVYRWNRPVYDLVDGRPHLRVENRALPAGPSVIDVLANAAFYYGALRVLSEEDRPVWTKMSFPTAEENFLCCAQRGMDATLYWPRIGEISPDELVLRRLLPAAHEGLERWGVAQEVRDRYLGVIEARAKTGRNGATWQTETVEAFERRGADRATALTKMLQLYCEGMHSNEPVHTWPVP
jgi:hypothetical protein